MHDGLTVMIVAVMCLAFGAVAGWAFTSASWIDDCNRLGMTHTHKTVYDCKQRAPK